MRTCHTQRIWRSLGGGSTASAVSDEGVRGAFGVPPAPGTRGGGRTRQNSRLFSMTG